MTILSVDDDVEDQELFTEAISIIDPLIVCVRATGGIEAYEFLCENTYLSIDCIFLDINMPKMNGIELLLLINKNERLKKIPVYMLSTSCSESDMAKINLLGATLLQKQNQFRASVKMLSSVLHYQSGLLLLG